MNKLIQQAIDIFGTQTALAEAMDKAMQEKVRQQDVWNWLHKKYDVAPKFAKCIGEVTEDAVPAFKFYPDLFDSPPETQQSA